MITRVWMDEDGGAMRLAIELNDSDVLVVDLTCDPPSVMMSVLSLDTSEWVEMVPEGEAESCDGWPEHDWKPGDVECRRCGADLSHWNEES